MNYKTACSHYFLLLVNLLIISSIDLLCENIEKSKENVITINLSAKWHGACFVHPAPDY